MSYTQDFSIGEKVENKKITQLCLKKRFEKLSRYFLSHIPIVVIYYIIYIYNSKTMMVVIIR